MNRLLPAVCEVHIVSRRVGNRMIQPVFIAEQDGKTRMLLNELAVAHHLKDTPYRYNKKIGLRQWVVVKMVGKMPTKVCMNAGVGGGILPTLRRITNAKI